MDFTIKEIALLLIGFGIGFTGLEYWRTDETTSAIKSADDAV